MNNFAACAAAIAALVLAAPAQASQQMYLYVEGAAQGDMTGDVTVQGRESSIEVIAWSHEIVSPRDAATGRATSRIQTKPLVITKPIDRSSPLLMQALVNNENLREVRLIFVDRDKQTGAPRDYYRIELSNAAIIGIAQEGTVGERDIEKISFSYAQMTQTHVETGRETAVSNLTLTPLKGIK
ncbi:MAG: type VI secretion system tube protein Hcp [Parvularculaceae bacterium]